MPASTSSKHSASSSKMSKPIWATGPEQVKVELLSGGMYDVDVDIATRMGIAEAGVKADPPVTVTGCSAAPFERALTFCANDRACEQPPTEELLHIINEMAPTNAPPQPKPTDSTASVSQQMAAVQLDDDEEDEDEEDGSYEPSSDSEASDSGEEYSDTDLADIGTAALKAERDEAEQKGKQKE